MAQICLHRTSARKVPGLSLKALGCITCMVSGFSLKTLGWIAALLFRSLAVEGLESPGPVRVQIRTA